MCSSPRLRSACRYFVTAPRTDQIKKLLASVALFPERAHLVGAYSLGKAQRVIALIRAAGYDAPIYLHGAMEKITRYYESRGVALGELRPVKGMKKADLAGTITLAPPRPPRISGHDDFPIRSRRLPRAGCGCARAHASAASNCRW